MDTQTLVKNLTQEIEAKRAEAIQIMKMAESGQLDANGMPIYDATKLDTANVRARESELKELESKLTAARLAAFHEENVAKFKEMHQPEYKYTLPTGSGNGNPPFNYHPNGESKSLADYFFDNQQYKGRAASPRRFTVDLPNFDMKTLFVSPHYIQESVRQPIVVPFALRPLRVSGLIPQTTTNANVIRYMEQTVFGDNAATVSESGVKPEAQVEWVERSDEVEKIAVWIPVTEEALDDEPQLRALLDETLREMVLREEEDQLLGGNGTRPNLLGFLNKTGVQTQAAGADNAPDAIFKAFTKVRWTGYAEPDGIVIHPNDWEPIRLLKTTTNEYVWGHPSVVGPDTLWGKRVVVTNAITENTALVGDFSMFSRIYRKTGIRVDVSDSHSDYFIYNKLAMRAEERLALIITRPSAFCKVTGI